VLSFRVNWDESRRIETQFIETKFQDAIARCFRTLSLVAQPLRSIAVNP
jgi:hypothetical protein